MIQEGLRQYFKKRRRSDWGYDVLAYTPYLHDAETLGAMLKRAETRHQKACIMTHIVHFWKVTSQFSDYRKIYDTLYDEFS